MGGRRLSLGSRSDFFAVTRPDTVASPDGQQEKLWRGTTSVKVRVGRRTRDPASARLTTLIRISLLGIDKCRMGAVGVVCKTTGSGAGLPFTPKKGVLEDSFCAALLHEYIQSETLSLEDALCVNTGRPWAGSASWMDFCRFNYAKTGKEMGVRSRVYCRLQVLTSIASRPTKRQGYAPTPTHPAKAVFVRPSKSVSAGSHAISYMQLTDRHIFFTWDDARRRRDISLFEDTKNVQELLPPITPTLDREFQVPPLDPIERVSVGCIDFTLMPKAQGLREEDWKRGSVQASHEAPHPR
ncbi:hypothetical protein EDB83DRAFT_2547117, partial [Lactarius deliciosus]